MDLSIIIVNWNSTDFLTSCLTSIYAGSLRVSFEIVVIDNASFDGCDRMLSNRFPEVHFVQGTTNTGFAGANNTSFSRTVGTTVCFLNPDTVIRGAALQTLFDALHYIADAGAVGALLLNGDGTVQNSCVLPFPTIMNQALDFEWLRRCFPRAGLFGAAAMFSDQKKPQVVESVSGACIMMNRETFVEIGKFSSDYFMYAEDIDLCRKIRMTGQKIYLINAAEIIHFGGGSSTKRNERLFGDLLMRESNYRLLRKFRGRGYARCYRLTIGLSALLRLTVLSLWLLPATIVGRRHAVAEILQKWWHLLGWVAGIRQVPSSLETGCRDV